MTELTKKEQEVFIRQQKDEPPEQVIISIEIRKTFMKNVMLGFETFWIEKTEAFKFLQEMGERFNENISHKYGDFSVKQQLERELKTKW